MSQFKRGGIIVCAALIMFAVISCDNGGGGVKIPAEMRGKEFQDDSGNSLQFGDDKVVLNDVEYEVVEIINEEGGVKRIVFSGSGNYIRVKDGNIIEVHIGNTPSENSTWEQKPESSQAGDFTYTETATAVTITGYIGTSSDVTIPAQIKGKPVTAIGDMAFLPEDIEHYDQDNDNYYVLYKKCSNIPLTSVTIPDSVTTIGFGAFALNELTSVTIPNSVTTIGVAAFENNQLTSITIPDSVTYLSGFSNNQLTSITIPDSVTYLSGFSNNQLTSVTIPDSVTTIGEWAFGYNELTSVTIPNSVTTIGDAAFYWNRQLTSVTIGTSVTTIGGLAFNDNQLISVTIGANVTLNFPFGNGFETAYNNGGKQAGTYTRPDTDDSTKWTKE